MIAAWINYERISDDLSNIPDSARTERMTMEAKPLGYVKHLPLDGLFSRLTQDERHKAVKEARKFGFYFVSLSHGDYAAIDC